MHDRRLVHHCGLVYQSDCGSQYVSARYTERLAEAGIEASVGSIGKRHDIALAEKINGLYKTGVIHPPEPSAIAGAHLKHSNGRSRTTIPR